MRTPSQAVIASRSVAPLASLLAGALLTAALPGIARAADLTIQVTTPAGQPVENAVVTVRPKAGGWAAQARTKFAWNYQVVQHNIQFDPFVLVVPRGAEVTFPNRDKVRHHVYSFSPAKKFEIKLYGREEDRRVVFDKAGVVSLGCNIHDGMIAHIYVTDTVHAAKTGADGLAVIKGVPAGSATLTVWQPYLRAARNEVVETIEVSGQGTLRRTVRADVRAPR